MSKVNLRETVAEAPVKKGDRYRVIIARPGQGSSGNYSEDLFRRDAEKLIPKGAQSFINHGERDPEKMIGVFPDGGYFDEEEKAVVGDLQVFEHWKAWVAEVFPYVGVSLYALGNADDEGNVTEILEDPYNGADIVARPGLRGSQIDKLYESALAHSDEKPTVTVAEETNGVKMEEKLDKLIDLMTSLVADKKTEDSAKAQVEADEAVAAARVESFAAAVKAVDEADLFDSQRESILESAKAGVDVAPLIESAKTVKAEALAALAEAAEAPAGRIIGETATKFGAWA